MSMDDVEQNMYPFIEALESFQTKLRDSVLQLEVAREELDPLWQDSMRAEYNLRWEEIDKQLVHYRDHIGPECIEFMHERVSYLSRYLHGE